MSSGLNLYSKSKDWKLYILIDLILYKKYHCQAQHKPRPANPQLGAEIASQLWGTTIHPTPYNLHPLTPFTPGIVVLPVSSLIITTVGTGS